VIAIAFLLLIVALTLALSLLGMGPGKPVIGETLMLVGLFAAFFGTGIYIGAALGVLGLIVGFVFSDRPFWLFIGQTVWAPSSSFVLVAVPLFLLMGEILLRAGISDRLYRTLNIWTNQLPGGLLHTNIASSAVFSAISGSSVATAATMGSVAMSFFQRTRYDPKMVMGSLAAGGALGNLIPPGITFIIYGLITETSVGALYVAAVGPSVLVVLLFTLVILLRARTAAPADPAALRYTWVEKLASLRGLLPTIVLVGLVLGTIYGGLATPTESAALGVVGAIALAATDRKLTFAMLNAAAEATARNTALIGLILFGAYLLNYVFVSLGVPQVLARLVSELPLPPWAILALIVGFYLALGTFMEGFSMIVTTIPIVFPVVIGLGYDPVWFGVIVVMLVEIALISPPDGTVLYVLQGMRRDGGPITDIFSGVMPFMAVYILAIVVLMLLPGVALWLPSIAR
jgi:tripartite ATP-independent transporter DctM subunit